MVDVSRAFRRLALVRRVHLALVILLGSALVHIVWFTGIVAVFRNICLAQPNQLEASAIALAPLPCTSASPTGCVSEPFGALASSTPPGWGRARRPGTQVARVCFTAIWARPVRAPAEVLAGRDSRGWDFAGGGWAPGVNAVATPVGWRHAGYGLPPSAEGAVRVWARPVGEPLTEAIQGVRAHL